MFHKRKACDFSEKSHVLRPSSAASKLNSEELISARLNNSISVGAWNNYSLNIMGAAVEEAKQVLDGP